MHITTEILQTCGMTGTMTLSRPLEINYSIMAIKNIHVASCMPCNKSWYYLAKMVVTVQT